MASTDRVLFWAPLPPPYSGPAVASASLMAEVARQLPDSTIENATCRPTNMSKGRFNLSGIAAFLRSYVTFVAALRRSRCRIFYMVIAPGTVGFLRDSVVIWTAVIARKRVVLHLRGGNYANFYESAPPMLRLLIRHTWGRAAIGIVQSECLTSLWDRCAPHVRMAVLPNGLPPGAFLAERSPHGAASPITLLFLGYLTYTKGFTDLITAYKALHARYGSNVRLIFAGERPQDGAQFATFLSGEAKTFYLANLKSLEDEINAFIDEADRYHAEYLGVVSGPDKERMFQRADIFVLPSFMEGFSMAVLEAMFAGLPIVTTSVGSNRDIIRDSKNGFLVPPGSPLQLEERLRTLVDDPCLRSRMGQTNATEARILYTIDKVAARMVDILAAV